MKSSLILLALFSATAATHAADTGAQVNALFRVLKPDGTTVLGQAAISPGGGAMATINVKASDALVAANGKCAFNVKYDEVSSKALTGTTNRLYSNDTLIAQNTAIDLQAGVMRTIWTQPYFSAGQNNVKVVINATAANPSVGWVRVNVDGTCKAEAPKPVPAPAPAPAPAPRPAPEPVKMIVPGSSDWNTLNTAWGYSNYATTQLKGKGYARYNDLAKLNADLTAVVNAKKVSQADYTSLMARWNALANSADFRAAMAKVTPSGDRKS